MILSKVKAARKSLQTKSTPVFDLKRLLLASLESLWLKRMVTINSLHEALSMQGANRTTQSQSIASLDIQQLQQMIENTIRAQYGGPPRSTLMYSNPYMKQSESIQEATS